MLASRFHLPGYLIPKLKARGKLYRFPNLSLLVLKEKEQKISRFSIILSQKFDKKAVVRNQTRRNFFEALRGLLPKIEPGYLVVLLPRKILKEKNLDQTQEALEQALVKIGIIK